MDAMRDRVDGFFAVVGSDGQPVGRRIPSRAELGGPSQRGSIDVFFFADEQVTFDIPPEAVQEANGVLTASATFFDEDGSPIWNTGPVVLHLPSDRFTVGGVILPRPPGQPAHWPH